MKNARKVPFTKISIYKEDLVREIMPHLLEVQKKSYERLVGSNARGIREVFEDYFPIEVEREEPGKGKYKLKLFLGDVTGEETDVWVRLEEPELDPRTCKEHGLTYAYRVYLIVNFHNGDTGEIKTEKKGVFIGELPKMTERGTFVINGTEKVVVNQFVRSPGVYFEKNAVVSGHEYKARVIPDQGSWVELTIDEREKLVARIGKTKKVGGITFLRALGYEVGEKFIYYSDYGRYKEEEDVFYEKFVVENEAENLIDWYPNFTIYDELTGEILHHAGERITEEKSYKIEALAKKVSLSKFEGAAVFFDIYDYDGYLLVPKGEKIEGEVAKRIKKLRLDYAKTNFRVRVPVPPIRITPVIKNSIEADPLSNRPLTEVVQEIYRRFKPSETHVDPQEALLHLRYKAFSSEYYDLSKVGRYQLNAKLGGGDIPLTVRVLTRTDISRVVNELVYKHDHNIESEIDNIDHLGNRRVKAVGELIQDALRAGVANMVRYAREKLKNEKPEVLEPKNLINARMVMQRVHEFFASGKLTQFLDQTNVLSELTHKRRLSALGPGGLTRERAGIEARDIHYSHYGRVCPIETPEGQNIGLLLYFAAYAKINRYGFIVTPYFKVRKGKLTGEIEWLTAEEEDRYRIAPFDAPRKDNVLLGPRVSVRYKGKTEYVEVDEVDYMDIAPNQMVGVSASLIPFLEHDDANRALMGSNMQRQAVPLIRPEPPLVYTGMEEIVGKTAGGALYAEADGEVVSVTGEKIVVREKDGYERTYRLERYVRSNQGTCFDQVPVVKKGDRVKKGDPLTTGPCIVDGELALGRNVLVAFMPWEGYNYEDAIVVSERLVKEGWFNSVHLEEFVAEERTTKQGKEIITADNPAISDEARKYLDPNGLVMVGARVKPGDVLVAKIAPRPKEELTAEEELLNKILNATSPDYKNASKRVPHGTSGVVIHTSIIRKSDAKGRRKEEFQPGVEAIARVVIAKEKKLSIGDKMSGRHGNKGVVAIILPEEDMPYLEDGTPVDIVLNPLGVPSRMNLGQLLETHLGWAAWKLGNRYLVPPFNSKSDEAVKEELKKAGLPESGKTVVYDGKTGEPFENPVVVGYMYMMKLHHLAEDKIHARSTGSYTLVTEQPLGGKSHFGGQRFGEMEFWALEAYGASNLLHELATVKSDDIEGRKATYEAIVKKKFLPEPGTPESFNVLVRELQGLVLEMEFYKKQKPKKESPVKER